MTGLKLQHIPYRGAGPALNDLILGRVDVMFNNIGAVMPLIKGGKLRALGVTSSKRAAELPDVPTVADTLPGYEASAFFGMSAPKGTPKECIDVINKQVNAALKAPGMLKKLRDLGGIPIEGPPEVLGKIVADETAKWEKVVHAAKLSVE